MKYIDSPSNDAYFNMALEEYVFEGLPQNEEYFMLWQNRNAIVVGKYQNTVEEINQDVVREKEISVVRRLSGGGAMYQDMGNLNFTFIVNQEAAKSLDFTLFTQPVVHALAQVGVTAQNNSRNDITINDQKFSGNSQYNKRGRTMHHGTLLFNSNLTVIGDALNVKADKIESKGIKSVRSRVTNILPHMPSPVSLAEFKEILLTHMFEANTIEPYTLTEKELAAVHKLRDEKYATWDWNYGRSPAYGIRKQRRFAFGNVTLDTQVKEGAITAIEFSGDFFGNGDIAELGDKLIGTQLHTEAILQVLGSADVGYYIHGMDAETFAELLVY